MTASGSTGPIANLAWMQVVEDLTGEDRSNFEKLCRGLRDVSREVIARNSRQHRNDRPLPEWFGNLRPVAVAPPQSILLRSAYQLRAENVEKVGTVMLSPRRPRNKRRRVRVYGQPTGGAAGEAPVLRRVNLRAPVAQVGVGEFRGAPVLLAESPEGRITIYADGPSRQSMARRRTTRSVRSLSFGGPAEEGAGAVGPLVEQAPEQVQTGSD